MTGAKSAIIFVESCFLWVNGARMALDTTSSLLAVVLDEELSGRGGGLLSRFFSCARLENAMLEQTGAGDADCATVDG